MEKSILVENAIAAVKDMVKVVEERVALNNALANVDNRMVDYEGHFTDVRNVLEFISEYAESEDVREEAENAINRLATDGQVLYDDLSDDSKDITLGDVDILTMVINALEEMDCPELTKEAFDKFMKR